MRIGLATLVALAEAGDAQALIMCRLWHVHGPDFSFEVWASHERLWRVRVNRDGACAEPEHGPSA